MNEEQIKKLIQSMKKASLSAQEKFDLKNKILLSMEEPVPVPSSKIFDMFERTRLMFSSFRPAYTAVLVTIFVLSGGISFAAENVLPGNLLYPIKVKVNEKISGLFIVGSLNKAERETTLIDKRLKEFKLLIAKGKLSNKKIKIVEERIVVHAENSKSYLADVEEKKDFKGSLEVQAKLKSSLAINEKNIVQVGQKIKDISPLVTKAKEELSKISDRKNSLEETLIKKQGVDPAVISEMKRNSAKTALIEAMKFADEERKEANEDVDSPAKTESLRAMSEATELSLFESHLKLIEAKILAGEVFLKSGNYAEATKLFEEAYQSSRTLMLSPKEIRHQEILSDKSIETEAREQKDVISLKEIIQNGSQKETVKVPVKYETENKVEPKTILKDNASAQVSSSIKDTDNKKEVEKAETADSVN